jgi:hypothetical protein
MKSMAVMGDVDGALVGAVLKKELKDYYDWQKEEAENRGLMATRK